MEIACGNTAVGGQRKKCVSWILNILVRWVIASLHNRESLNGLFKSLTLGEVILIDMNTDTGDVKVAQKSRRSS